jgi:hypothetical protein
MVMKIKILNKQDFWAIYKERKDCPDSMFLYIHPHAGVTHYKEASNNLSQHKMNNVDDPEWKPDQWATYKYISTFVKKCEGKDIVYICDNHETNKLARTIAQYISSIYITTAVWMKNTHHETYRKLLNIHTHETPQEVKGAFNLLLTCRRNDLKEVNAIVKGNSLIRESVLSMGLIDVSVCGVSPWELEQMNEVPYFHRFADLVKYVNAVA